MRKIKVFYKPLIEIICYNGINDFTHRVNTPMKIFVSYSRVDKDFCNELVNEVLDAHEVWYDKNLTGGDLWWNKILERIDWCDTFIYLLSPESATSEYCLKEEGEARKLNKFIVPVMIRPRTKIPEHLKPTQYIDLSGNLQNNVDGVIKLLNDLLILERRLQEEVKTLTLEDLDEEDFNPPNVDNSATTTNQKYFNYVFYLEQTDLSNNTKSQYYRYICFFLNYATGDEVGKTLNEYMDFLGRIPLEGLLDSLSVSQIRAWFEHEVARGISDLNVRHRALLKLAQVLNDLGHLSEKRYEKLRGIEPQYRRRDKTSYRQLDAAEIQKLFHYVGSVSSGAKMHRDSLIIGLALILKPNEIIGASWKNFDETNGIVSYWDGSGKDVILPQIAQESFKMWRSSLGSDAKRNSSLLRPMTRMGKIMGESMNSTSTVSRLIARYAERADLGHITPSDLQLSARNISSIDKIL